MSMSPSIVGAECRMCCNCVQTLSFLSVLSSIFSIAMTKSRTRTATQTRTLQSLTVRFVFTILTDRDDRRGESSSFCLFCHTEQKLSSSINIHTSTKMINLIIALSTIHIFLSVLSRIPAPNCSLFSPLVTSAHTQILDLQIVCIYTERIFYDSCVCIHTFEKFCLAFAYMKIMINESMCID